ncbi:MAG: Gfo/Idh/MocA family oxidoreductase [Acidimicrobiia bacterium]
MTARVGVIGTGFGARVVAPVFASTPGCEVVDVVSARDDAGVATLCDRSDLDLVSVHSPPFLHTAHVRRALVNGHAVICDKPFGVDSSQSEALLAAAEAAECVHLVNFEFRYDPMREKLRSLIAEGVIGPPEHVSWTHISAGSRVPMRAHGWLFDRAMGGGFVGAWGSHAVDALRLLVGEVVAAEGECRTTITERPDRDGNLHPCDAEDGFTASLTFAGGASAAIDATFAGTASVAPRLVITGSEGVLESVGDARINVRRSDGTRDEHARPKSDNDPHLEPMQRFATVVRDALDEGVSPPGAPTFADGLACARVLDAIRA